MYGQYPYQYQTPYQQAFQNQYTQPQFQPPAAKYDVVRVNGQHGAEAFQMAPNSSVLLLDESAPLVWLKTTDGAGYPTVTPYSITPYQPEKPVDTKSLEERVTRLEEVLNEQSHFRSTERKADDATEPRANQAGN